MKKVSLFAAMIIMAFVGAAQAQDWGHQSPSRNHRGGYGSDDWGRRHDNARRGGRNDDHRRRRRGDRDRRRRIAHKCVIERESSRPNRYFVRLIESNGQRVNTILSSHPNFKYRQAAEAYERLVRRGDCDERRPYWRYPNYCHVEQNRNGRWIIRRTTAWGERMQNGLFYTAHEREAREKLNDMVDLAICDYD